MLLLVDSVGQVRQKRNIGLYSVVTKANSEITRVAMEGDCGFSRLYFIKIGFSVMYLLFYGLVSHLWNTIILLSAGVERISKVEETLARIK